MKNAKSLAGWLTCVFVLGCVDVAQAQSPCPSDSLPLNVSVTTDAWGYELYWELIDASAACGDGTALLWGGNPEVGCGDGLAGLPSEVYDNNTLYTSATICVSEEDSLVLIHRDSYGDGGSDFAIALGGNEAFGFDGSGTGNDWSFQPVLAVADLPCLAEPIFADTMTWVGSTEDASVSPNEPAPPALGCGTYGGWCEAGLENTVWLSWEVPQDGGVFEISTCNEQTTFDTQLALWRVTDCADFESYELVNANDDAGCGLGLYRSTLLTPCLEGGETMMLQIDGYYGEVGTVEVSVTTAAAEAWAVSAGVQDLSCSLLTSFDPNGLISVNSNVGVDAVDWMWEGPFGFTSDAASIGPLLPGDYTLEASFCGQTFSASYEVGEPAPLELEVSLSPDCALGSTTGVVDIEGGQGVTTATWTSGAFGTTGLEVSGLPGGLFEVDVVDENGCEASEVVWIESVGVPDVDLGPDQFGCAGDAFTLLAPLGAGLTYEWTTGASGALAVVQTDTPGTLVVGVEVTDGAGCTGSDAVILTLDDCTTALEDLGQVFHLNVFPNPFVDDIQVDLPESHAGGTPQLRDLSGREVPCVWTVQGTRCRTHVEVPPGVYFLSIAPGFETIRLVKQ